jgi:hypothetical protein
MCHSLVIVYQVLVGKSTFCCNEPLSFFSCHHSTTLCNLQAPALTDYKWVLTTANCAICRTGKQVMTSEAADANALDFL